MSSCRLIETIIVVAARQVFTNIHNKVKEISYPEDMELRNH